MKNFLRIFINSVNECIIPFSLGILLTMILSFNTSLRKESYRSMETDAFIMSHVHQLYIKRDRDFLRKELDTTSKKDSILLEIRKDSIDLHNELIESNSTLEKLKVIYGE